MANAISKPRQIFVPHPVLGWKLSADRKIEVPFRKGIVHTTNSAGWRTVTNQPEQYRGAIGFYGCSFTYGTSLDDRETFTSLLQAEFTDFKILNRGVGGHSTVQSLLSFRSDLLRHKVQAAIFPVISDHKYRNAPHPQRMRVFLSPEWHTIGVEHFPYANLKPGGGVNIRYVPIWQPVLRHDGLRYFLPDEIMLNGLTVGVLKEVRRLASEFSIPVGVVLLDNLDVEFNQSLLNEVEGTTDISTPHDAEHRFIPHDLHPNVRANIQYAERLRPIVNSIIKDVNSK